MARHYPPARRRKTPADLDRFIERLPDAFLACRTLGHAWTPRTAGWVRDARAYHATYVCTRCITERHVWLDRNGDVVGGHYAYTDGYTHTGQGRMTGKARSALRLESLSRLTDTPNLRAV